MENHPSLKWPQLPSYTPVLELFGRGLILAAVVLFLGSALAYGLARQDGKAARLARVTFTTGCSCLIGAFGLLAWLIYNRQYQFQYVFAHSDNWLPDGKRIASLWGGQEGSFLLWAVMASLFALASVAKTQIYRRWYTVVYALFLGGLAGILAYESPFKLWQAPADLPMAKGLMPPDGAGLTPALINWWMQIHPPTIFAGFGSLTVMFAFALAALIHGDMKTWIKLVRPWALISASFTGLGLCMGGFWAYETLGWGGFWMWDPVENAALIPWLCTVAFIHGLFIQVARGKWIITNAVLGALSLLSFMYGTFLTRSGFLGDTSVHSFASMERGALSVLIGLGVACVLGTVIASLYRFRQIRIERTPSTDGKGATLETAYSGGISLLLMLALSSGVGMSVPLIMSLRGQKPSVVEEVLYNRVTPWFFVPLVLLMTVGPYLGWRAQPKKEIANRVSTSLALSLGFLGIGMFLLRSVPQGFGPKWADRVNTPVFGFLGMATVPTIPWILLLAWICLFGVMANTVRLVEVLRKAPLHTGAFLSHIGVILTLLGLIVSRGFESKAEFTVQNGRPGQALGYNFSFVDISGKNFMERENRVRFKMEGRGESLEAKPTLFYTETAGGEEPSPTVRPFIFHRPLHDLYVTLYPLAFDATESTVFKIGEKRQFEGHVIQYTSLVREGEAGMTGTKFGAKLLVTDLEGVTHEVVPKVQIEQGNMRKERVEVGDFVIELEGIDAATKSSTIRLKYREPVMPMEIYYKPLPGLVWWGTGIMFVGGLISTLRRRKALRDEARKGQAEEA